MPTEQLIDIRKTIASKNPKLLKVLPNFLINYIRRTMHEDQINAILEDHKGVTGLDFARSMVQNVFKIQLEINGFDTIPEKGRYIFVANHPWGGMEAAALLDIVGRKFQNPRFIVNDVLMSIKNYHPLFIPVNKHGSQGKANALLMEENFASDRPILIFPAGLVSRKINGRVMDLEWKKNFVTKAIQHKRDVVPVYIDGRNSDFFYRVYKFRKALGIKANLEMFYLVDEMFKNTAKHLPFYFGKPIPYSTFDNSKKKDEWAREVQAHVYRLKEDLTADFIS